MNGKLDNVVAILNRGTQKWSQQLPYPSFATDMSLELNRGQDLCTDKWYWSWCFPNHH